MSGVRLTRRGRLVFHALPVLLVFSSGVQTLVHRIDDRADRASERLTAAPAPEASRTSALPSRSPSATASVTASPSATAAPAASARRTPRPTATVSPRPTRTARASYAGSGDLMTVSGSSAVHGRGPLRRFTVEVEKGLAVDPAAFAAAVESALFDPRGWAGDGRMSFQRVASGPVSFRVTLASPRTTDRLCRPLDTGGIYSCWNGSRAVLNAMRWQQGATSYRGDLPSYRVYMVNHEVGHGLGRGHRMSCGAGGLAPVMMQQTKSLYGCRRNPWPLAAER